MFLCGHNEYTECRFYFQTGRCFKCYLIMEKFHLCHLKLRELFRWLISWIYLPFCQVCSLSRNKISLDTKGVTTVKCRSHSLILLLLWTSFFYLRLWDKCCYFCFPTPKGKFHCQQAAVHIWAELLFWKGLVSDRLGAFIVKRRGSQTDWLMQRERESDCVCHCLTALHSIYAPHTWQGSTAT